MRKYPPQCATPQTTGQANGAMPLDTRDIHTSPLYAEIDRLRAELATAYKRIDDLESCLSLEADILNLLKTELAALRPCGYWAMNGCHDIEWFDTAKEAKEAAEFYLEQEREIATGDGEWILDVEFVKWGTVVEEAMWDNDHEYILKGASGK